MSKPIAKDYRENESIRGTGQMGGSFDYLRNDPSAYYYQKFINDDNKFLNDDMWVEATKRGEINSLILALDNAKTLESKDLPELEKLKEYGDIGDYDAYMLALSMPMLDNTEKVDRFDTAGNLIESSTDREWSTKILEDQFQKYDAQLIEERKANVGFFTSAAQNVAGYIMSAASTLISGAVSGFQDLYNILEGAANLIVNEGGDDSIGDRFLYAWSNDEKDWLQRAADYGAFVAYDYERKFTNLVDAEEAYEQGFRQNGADIFDNPEAAIGVGAGRGTWGRIWNASLNSLGYLVPALVAAAATGGASLAVDTAKTAATTGGKLVAGAAKGMIKSATVAAVQQSVFYGQIFSGNIKDTVTMASFNGQSYRDLNAGVVVANAALKAAGQWAVEYALGKVMGFSGMDKMMGAARSAGKISAKIAERGVKGVADTGIKAAARVAGRLGKDMIKEGLEETLQDLSDGMIDSLFGGLYRTRGLETMSIQNLTDSFVVGALLSGVVGSIQNTKVLFPKNKVVALDEAGKAYQIGAFQNLNFRETMSTVNEWSNILNDPKSSAEQKADASFKLSVTLDTVGSVMRTMGTDRAMMANKALMEQLKIDEEKQNAKLKLSDPSYAKALLQSFQEAQSEVFKKYVSQKQAEKIEKAALKVSKKLKKNGVTKIDTVINKNVKPNDPDVGIDPQSIASIKGVSEGLGVNEVVGVTGLSQTVIKSDDIVFVDNKLIQAGDVATIIKGLAYDQVQTEVSNKLTESQKRMLLEDYSKITGVQGTIDDAITALLFDKTFYVFVLLRNLETKDAPLDIFLMLDQLVRTQANRSFNEGKITKVAYNRVLNKVYETMKEAIIVCATSYQKIDLNKVSNLIIPAALKDEINNNRNVIFTDNIDDGVSMSKLGELSNSKVQEYDRYLDQFLGRISAEDITILKKKVRSSKVNDRIDAFATLMVLSNHNDSVDNQKLIYLSTTAGLENIEREYLFGLEKFFGDYQFVDLSNGDISFDQLPPEAKFFLTDGNYDWSNNISRNTALREVLYSKSNKSLTIGMNGTILKIIEANSFLKDEFGYSDTTNKLKSFLETEPVKTLQDISKIKIHDKSLANTKIVIDPNLKANGLYVEGKSSIILKGNNIIETLLHEATHTTQYLTYRDDGDVITGGTDTVFEELPDDVKDDIIDYIDVNFPTYSELMARQGQSYAMSIYYLLAGEIQANSTAATHLYDLGFRWRDNKKILVSPDGEKRWSMTKKPKPVKPILPKAKAKPADGIRALLDDILAPEQTSGVKPKSKPKPDLSSFSKEITGRVSYVNNKVAAESNLKYWIQTGKPIYLSPRVQEFVVSTTHNFSKLPIVLQDKIKKATLTTSDITDYVATAAKMNDYTFKTIAKIIYDNEELAEISFADMKKLMNNIEELSILSYLSPDINQLTLTVAEMMEKEKELRSKLDSDPGLALKWENASKKAQSVYTGKEYTESHADPLQLALLFFNHYNGTLSSLMAINNLGKNMSYKQSLSPIRENLESTSDADDVSKRRSRTGPWNWVTKLKQSTIDYPYESDQSIPAEELDRTDKIKKLEEYITFVVGNRVFTETTDPTLRQKEQDEAIKQIRSETKKLDDLSDIKVDEIYNMILKDREFNTRPSVSTKPKVSGRTEKSLKDSIRNSGKRITERLLKLKRRYASLSPEIKLHFDPLNNYELKSDYQKLKKEDLEQLNSLFSEASKKLGAMEKAGTVIKTAQENLRLKSKLEAAKSEQEKLRQKQKTFRQKVQHEFVTKITEQTFEFVSPYEANDIVKHLLNTSWDETRMSTVQGLSNNADADVANGKKFFGQNTTLLLSASLTEIDAATRWFLDTKMNNVDDTEFKKFSAVKLYFLGYVFSESRDGLFTDLDHNLKQKIENHLKSMATNAGTTLSIWRDLIERINPVDTMKNASMEIDGVELTLDEKEELFEAATSGNIEAIKKIQQKLIERVEKERTSKKSIFRKITTVRAMSMLSSPITWLRNISSNESLKETNKLASKIGNKLFSKKHVTGQLRLDQKITPEIQKFIDDNFLDNGLFETLISNLSRYNVSDISPSFRDASGQFSKEAIFAQLVIKSMYNKYYNENMFKSKFMNSVHSKLMKALSDNNFVREASIRYFGKMIAEKGYNLKGLKVDDAIMNDFASSVGLGLSDYMHSDNIFTKLEGLVTEKGEGALFVYKLMLPFISAGHQWFKASIRLSPIGLAQSIIKLSRLEKNVALAESNWASGKSQIAPELTEYMLRRNLGHGVIGTIAWCTGLLLASLGFIELEDDDYGIPKLRIGNLRIDVSSIFGSNSLLAGAALVTGWKTEGTTIEKLVEGLNRMIDVTVSGLPLMQIVEMDMYSDGGFSMGMDQLESIALSFIPNLIKWIAGATYSGRLHKTNFFERAMAGIPFLGSAFVEKKVDPYTGGKGSWWDAFNRVVPFFSIDVASKTEKSAEQLGLTKTQLKGSYVINDKSFEVSKKDLTSINEAYGKWNASDIAAFYQDRMAIEIRVGNKYQKMRFSQMTDEQRKRAVQQIMSKNAEYAKIKAWCSAGNSYYGSASEYAELRRRGVSGGYYKGTKGFVEK